jgi:hypothetical protein
MTFHFKITLICLLGISLFASVAAQSKVKRPPVNKRVPSTSTAVEKPLPQPEPTVAPVKKNDRPGAAPATASGSKTVDRQGAEPSYFYEFTQPKFTITRITIKHDEAGRGTLTFAKGEFDEPITESFQLSPSTLAKISASLAALDFLNSTENYQFEKDFAHLGNVTFRLKKDGREREVHYNYTSNKYAKDLMDEYRRIGNQVIWIFDMNVSRENQPLDAPRMVDALQAYLSRGEISDPEQLVPFLQELSNDERIPLIARNHAAKMIKQIQKDKK